MHISNTTNTTNFGNGLIIATQDENTTSYPLFIKTNSADADESAESDELKAMANALWTDDIKKAYEDSKKD